MKTVAVLTKNEYLFRKIALELDGVPVGHEAAGASLLLFDLDTMEGEVPPGAVTLSADLPADVAVPFPLGAIPALLEDAAESAPLSLDAGGRVAFLHGKAVRLTEVEALLLSELLTAEGYRSREELLDAVWHGEADGGVLNVYIHYLREKLEKGGERIILSSRGAGYAIDEKFRPKKGGRNHA